MSECGCSIVLSPCEAHQATLDSGEETVHITVQFDDKYSRFKGNNHGVDLERVQRIELGIDGELMEFSEGTIADMLQKMSDERPFESEAFVLRALANALRGEDDHHRLILQHKKRGKFLSPTETEARHYQDISWLHTLANREKMGDKTEAGIAFIAEHWNVSRASVFAGIRRAEQYLKSGAEMFAKVPGGDNFRNPRPDKRRNA